VPAATLTWLDGEATQVLPLPDRGLAFGDGLFETLLLCAGQPLYLDEHLQRLWRGLDALSLPDCLQAARAQVESAAAEISAQGWQWCALRLTVTRGGGPRGYTPPPAQAPRLLLQAARLSADHGSLPAPATLGEVDIRLAAQPALAGIKHLNRLEQVLAARQAAQLGVDEALLLDSRGELASVIAGNLFLRRGDQLLTPRLEDCGVAGTRRALVMGRWAAAAGLGVREARLTPQDLEAADEAFYSNSLQGLRPLAGFRGRRWREHEACAALFAQYRGELP